MKKIFLIILTIGFFVPMSFVLAQTTTRENIPSALGVEGDNTNTSGSSAAATTLTAILTVNGQSTLNIPFVPSVRGQLNPATSVDLAWSTNIPDAQCSAGSNMNGNSMLPWYGALSSASGERILNIADVNNNWNLSLKCTWQGQSAEAQAQIIVGGGSTNGDVTPVPQSVSLTGNGQSGTITVTSGSQVLLAWTSTESIQCTASGNWSGSKSPNGQLFTDPIYTNQSYTITCPNSDSSPGMASTLTVYVSGQSSTTTITTPIPTPAPSTTTTTPAPSSAATCDSVSQAIVTAAGGCGSIDQTTYQNIYAACCPTVTQDTLLQTLNNDLANGPLTSSETTFLLGLLNTYLSQ